MGERTLNPPTGEIVGHVCAIACEADSDCPRHVCGDYWTAEEPYHCGPNGYCVLVSCTTADPPDAPE